MKQCGSSSEELKLTFKLVEAVGAISKDTKKNYAKRHATQFSVVLFLTISAIQVPRQKLLSITRHCGLEEGWSLVHLDCPAALPYLQV